MEIETLAVYVTRTLFSYNWGVGDNYTDNGTTWGTASLEFDSYSEGADTRRATLSIDYTEQ